MAVIMILGITAFHSSLTDQSISVSFDDGLEAFTMAQACAREGLAILKDDINYLGYNYLDLTKQEVTINGMACDALEIEDINSYTKKVSSLVVVGENPHFKRAEAELKYIIQSSYNNWQTWMKNGVEVVNDSLVLECCDEVIKQRITNTGSGWLNYFQMNDLATSGNDLTLLGVEGVYALEGTRVSNPFSLSDIIYYENSEIIWSEDKPSGTDIKIYTAVNNNPSAVPLTWLEATNNNPIPGLSLGDNLSDKFLWTKIELSTNNTALTPRLQSLTESVSMTESAFGQAESMAFSLNSNNSKKIKNAKIIWQSQEKANSQIVFEVNVYNGADWLGWETVRNGADIINLKNQDSLENREIKLKASFYGGSGNYSTLEEVKVFLELF